MTVCVCVCVCVSPHRWARIEPHSNTLGCVGGALFFIPRGHIFLELEQTLSISNGRAREIVNAMVLVMNRFVAKYVCVAEHTTEE